MQIVQVSKAAAESFMAEFEHLGNVGLGVWHWGALSGGELVSVVSYGVTSFDPNRGWASRIIQGWDCSVLQLCRGGTTSSAPRNIGSWLIARANKAIVRERGNSIVLAYSDDYYDEIGTIYQAANAIYVGMTNPKNQADYVINGRTRSGWWVRKVHGTRALDKLKRIDPNVIKVPLRSKHRYCFVSGTPTFKRVIKRRLSSIEEPYPKRDAECSKGMIMVNGKRVPSNDSYWRRSI